MTEFISGVVNLACTYMLLGVGYVIVYRASRILNFAHGGLVLLGAYLGFTFGMQVFGGNIFLTISIALILNSIIGVIIYRWCIQPVLGRPVFVTIILTIGIFMLIEGVVTVLWGSSLRSMQVALGVFSQNYPLPGGFIFATYDLAIVFSCIIFIGGLALFYRFSRLGMQMRGASENTLLAAQRGINIYFVTALAWGIAALGAALAGNFRTAGTILSPGLNLIGLKAFVVPLLGGMDSLLGIIPGGFIVALAEILAGRYVDPILAEVVPMIIMLLALIIRPWGLFGRIEEIQRL